MPDHPEPRGPDLTLGLAQDKLADGAKLLGHVGGEEVLLVRIGSEFVAIGAHSRSVSDAPKRIVIVGGGRLVLPLLKRCGVRTLQAVS